MEQNNLYKKLRFIALCLAIVCMVLSLIKRVKAQEVNYNTWADYVYNDTYSRMNSSTKTSMDSLNYHTLIEYLSIKFPYFLRYSNENSDDVYYIFSIAEEFAVQTMWGSFTNDIVHVKLNYSSSSVQTNGFNYSYASGTNVSPILVSFNNFNWNCIFPTIYISNDGYIQINNLDFYYSTSNVNMNYYENHDLQGTVSRLTTALNGYGRYLYAFYSNISDSSEHTFDTFNSNCKCYVTQDYNRGVYNHLDNTLTLKTDNTDGLKVYKQTIHNTSFLYIDYSDCVNIVPTYIEISSVFGNIDIDGTIYEIDYDNSSQYYHINTGTGKVYYQIPFSSLSLNDENIESAVLNDLEINVSWSTTLSNGNENLYWVTPIYLIGSPHNAPGYTPDSSNEQPQQTYTPEMNAEYYLEIYSMYYNGHTGSPFKYDDNINLYSSHQLALDSIKMQADILEMDTWYISSTDKELYASNTDLFGDYIYDNGFGLYYDAIVFDVYDRHVDGQINPVNIYKGTGILFTEKYYTRNGLTTLTDSLKDVIQYDHMCSDYLYLLYDVTWKKLKSIDYNIADYFTKQGNINNQIILILENINSFLPDIKGILDDILDALKNLQLSQLDTIDTKLTTIIDNISTPDTPFNEDDTVSEAIKYYETHNNNGVPTGQVYIDDKMSIWISGKVHLWLQGSDANTDKTSLINSVFETLTSIYDSMKNNNDIFPNIQYYLDAIAKNNNYGYETHGDYMTRFFKGNVDISTYDGISE